MLHVAALVVTHVKAQSSEIAVPLQVSVGLLLPIVESAARQLLEHAVPLLLAAVFRLQSVLDCQ